MSKKDDFKNLLNKKQSPLGSYLGDEENVKEDNENGIEHDKQNTGVAVNVENENRDEQHQKENDAEVDEEKTTLDEDDLYLRNLIQGRKNNKKKKKKVFTSFYLDPDLHDEIDKIVKNGVKGDKSLLINRAIRRYLEGVIE